MVPQKMSTSGTTSVKQMYVEVTVTVTCSKFAIVC